MLLPLNEYLDALCGHVIDVAKENPNAYYYSGEGGCYYTKGPVKKLVNDISQNCNLPAGCIIGQADRRMGEHAIFTNPERHKDTRQCGFIIPLQTHYPNELKQFNYPPNIDIPERIIDALKSRINIQIWACSQMQAKQDEHKTWGEALNLAKPFFTHIGYNV